MRPLLIALSLLSISGCSNHISAEYFEAGAKACDGSDGLRKIIGWAYFDRTYKAICNDGGVYPRLKLEGVSGE